MILGPFFRNDFRCEIQFCRYFSKTQLQCGVAQLSVLAASACDRLPGSQAPRLTGAPWQNVWEVRTLGASWHPRAWVEGDGVIRGAAAARAGEA